VSKTALVVEFRIKPGRRDDFLKLMKEHAAGSLAHSDGCLQFDVLVPKEVQFDAPKQEPDANRVFLYEVYRDEDAFQTHVKSPRVAKTRASYADMVESRRITRCAVQ
jgi:(4S)-4-hydroxy-5-phosphonooxypentane-2,3-dione isomerase